MSQIFCAELVRNEQISKIIDSSLKYVDCSISGSLIFQGFMSCSKLAKIEKKNNLLYLLYRSSFTLCLTKTCWSDKHLRQFLKSFKENNFFKPQFFYLC